MADPTMTINVGSCLGRTCLQWGADGDLTPLDLDLVLERLARVDQHGDALRQATLDRESCSQRPSSSGHVTHGLALNVAIKA